MARRRALRRSARGYVRHVRGTVGVRAEGSESQGTYGSDRHAEARKSRRAEDRRSDLHHARPGPRQRQLVLLRRSCWRRNRWIAGVSRGLLFHQVEVSMAESERAGPFQAAYDLRARNRLARDRVVADFFRRDHRDAGFELLRFDSMLGIAVEILAVKRVAGVDR